MHNNNHKRKVKWKTSINREWDSLFETCTHSTLAHSERGGASSSESDNSCQRSSLCFQVLLLLLVLILSLRNLWGFLLCGFPEENSLCLWSLVITAVHVILSDKILRSYWLNDKNLRLVVLWPSYLGINFDHMICITQHSEVTLVVDITYWCSWGAQQFAWKANS